MQLCREVAPKNIIEIAQEWDALATLRFSQMSSGSDITFSRIMLPTIQSIVQEENANTILDAGCGVGILTNYLSRFHKSVTGIDPSRKSIEIANHNFGKEVNFEISSIEKFSSNTKQKFDVITANMVVMDAPDILSFFSSSAHLLKKGGSLIFSITHPCFWPRYYGYEHEDWYKYEKQIFIESPFRISKNTQELISSTHVHRSLERYAKAIMLSGLSLELMIEPLPDQKTEAMYPSPWKYPRYLIGVCRNPKRL